MEALLILLFLFIDLFFFFASGREARKAAGGWRFLPGGGIYTYLKENIK
jgi:hypothetical protein